jgi:hypothetical protein
MLRECMDKKHILEVENAKRKKWIEIDIIIEAKIDLGTSSNGSKINHVKFTLCIGKKYPIQDVRVFCKTNVSTHSSPPKIVRQTIPSRWKKYSSRHNHAELVLQVESHKHHHSLA